MTAAQRLRQKLLDLAIRGKLVPQDANDEPAEVLFAKIREEKEKLVKAKKIKKEKPLPPITDEEKTFDLPKGWTWCRFGEICSKVGAGSTPKGGRSVYVDHGIKFIREQNVLNDGLCYDGMAFIDENINNHMA
ncbi:MAG: restriction endonuclease subunit S, partial [Kiritimatiellae bacterium]|nr:restriction endonuclease subunit S [Kiritimatiellia bacterium]